MKRKYNTAEEFVEDLKKIHNNKNYDYSLAEYKSNKGKVKIICKEKDVLGNEHGLFEMRASHLLNGHGCPKCAHRYMTTDEWIAYARLKHGDKYDYSKSKYSGERGMVEIICPVHGSFFQAGGSHLSGCGCPKCNGGVKYTNDDFLRVAKTVHGEKYDYSEVSYVSAKVPVKIICKRHGIFEQTPDQHLRGQGCPKCKSSKLEAILMSEFSKNSIRYDYQVYIDDSDKRTLDFYLTDYNVYVECQGEQHFMDVDFNGKHLLNHSSQLENDIDKYERVKSIGSDIIYFTLPNLFRNKNIKPDYEFYNDKHLFLSSKELIGYILGLKKCRRVDILSEFWNDMIAIDNSVIRKNNMFEFGNKRFFFDEIEENASNTLSNRRKSFSRGGYEIYTIFEDEYINHREIVIDKIKHVLGKNSKNNRIFGRACSIKEIDKSESGTFLNKYHIQGASNASVYIGAFFNGKLIAVMTFINEGNNNWNLNRFASDTNYVCCGVGGKMFKWFLRNYNPGTIKSFADRRWTPNENDNLYIKLGFKYDSRTSSDYRYFKDGDIERLHKFNFRKATLNRKYGLPLTMTETEMTKSLGYHKIFDSGLLKYIYVNENIEL